MGMSQQQRQHQQEEFTKKLAARKALLTEKGLDTAAIADDKVVKHLLAEINRSSRACASIAAREQTIASAKAKKEDHARLKAEARPKKKKTAPAAAPEKKEGKKKAKGKQ
jgi:hypothetical protein